MPRAANTALRELDASGLNVQGAALATFGVKRPRNVNPQPTRVADHAVAGHSP